VRVLGLDPGSRSTGWGLIERRGRILHTEGFGCLRPPRKGGRATALAALAMQLEDLLASMLPDVVAVETTFTARFPKASLALAEARGALLSVLGRWGGEVVEYEPARIKAAVVGNGVADKRQVAYVVRHELKLEREPASDAADALAIAVCYLRSTRTGSEQVSFGRGQETR
jgi:crossover junction endodeoxyribonuclease RuvC